MSKKLIFITFLGCLGPTAGLALGGGSVAVIDSDAVIPSPGPAWCVFLEQNSYQCTVFPKEGPTGPLDPFDVVIDLSDDWTDPSGLLADFMRAGKTVITTDAAPLALGVNTDATVKAWIGANAFAGAGDRLVTTVSDPILGDIPVGTELVDCSTSVCTALNDTSGHLDVRVLAAFIDEPDPDPIGIMRNFWEGGVSVYLSNGLLSGGNEHRDQILLNAVRIRQLVPTLDAWGVLIMAVFLGIAGTLVVRRRAVYYQSILLCPAWVFVSTLGAPTWVYGDVTSMQLNGVTQLQLGAGAPFHSTETSVYNLRSVAIPDSVGIVILWDESNESGSSQAFFAISSDGVHVEEPRATSYDLELRGGPFDPGVESPVIPESLTATSECELWIVQFITQPLAAYRMAVANQGATLYEFIPNHAYVARMSLDVRAAVAALPFVRVVLPYHQSFRLDPSLVQSTGFTREDDVGQRYNIQVMEPLQKTVLAEKILDIAGVVDSEDSGKRLITAVLTLGQVVEVARFDVVLFIDLWSPIEPDMNIVRAVSGTNYIETIGGYHGTGVRGEVFDSAFHLSHVDFAFHPLIVHGDPVSAGSHGASTSGIIFGTGAGNPDARGILPNGQGIIADWDNVGFGGPSRYTHTGELVDPILDYQAVFQSTSGGKVEFSDYTTISADMDLTLFDFDLTHCQAQGNSGIQYSRQEAWAKNTISVGGLAHYDNTNSDDDCWCGEASTGPAADGRIKPDLCHFNENILTLTFFQTYNEYTPNFNGTSAATPIVCGLIGLLMEMWADDSDSDGKNIFAMSVPVCNPATENCVFKRRPHAATARAMMINTARQYDWINGPTPNHDIDRYKQGWGVPHVGDLYDLRDKLLIVNESCVLPVFGVWRATVRVYSDEPALKAAIVYKDPPAVPCSNPTRINDLNLKVISPSAVVYRGNHGLSSGIWSTSGPGNDAVNTVENVFIQNPEPGDWTIEVKVAEVNEDGHVQTPGEPYDVDFAVVVSGVQPYGDCTIAGQGTIVTDRANCLAQSGTYQGDVTTCDPCPACQ